MVILAYFLSIPEELLQSLGVLELLRSQRGEVEKVGIPGEESQNVIAIVTMCRYGSTVNSL